MTLTGNVGNLHRMHNVTSHRFFLRTRVDTICEAERNTSCLFVLLSVSFLLGSMLISLFGYIVVVFFFKKHIFFSQQEWELATQNGTRTYLKFLNTNTLKPSPNLRKHHFWTIILKYMSDLFECIEMGLCVRIKLFSLFTVEYFLPISLSREIPSRFVLIKHARTHTGSVSY